MVSTPCNRRCLDKLFAHAAVCSVQMGRMMMKTIFPPTSKYATSYHPINHTRKCNQLCELVGGRVAPEAKEKVQEKEDLGLARGGHVAPREAKGRVEADHRRPHAPITFRTMTLSGMIARKTTKRKPIWMTWRKDSPCTPG